MIDASSVSFTFGMMQENKEDSFKLPRRFFGKRGNDFRRCDFVKELPAAEDFEIDAQSSFVEFVSAFWISCFVGDDFGAGVDSGMIAGVCGDEFSLDFGSSFGEAGISCTFWGSGSSDFWISSSSVGFWESIFGVLSSFLTIFWSS